jgi:hypothetical protein
MSLTEEKGEESPAPPSALIHVSQKTLLLETQGIWAPFAREPLYRARALDTVGEGHPIPDLTSKV